MNKNVQVQCVVCFGTAEAPLKFREAIPKFAEKIGAIALPPGWGFVLCLDGWSFVPVCSATCAAIYDPGLQGRYSIGARSALNLRDSAPRFATNSPGDAIATHPDPMPRFISLGWYNGRLGHNPDGMGHVRAVRGEPGRWAFSGRFLSSGRVYEVEAPSISELDTVLRGGGWLPMGSERVGG